MILLFQIIWSRRPIIALCYIWESNYSIFFYVSESDTFEENGCVYRYRMTEVDNLYDYYNSMYWFISV